MAGARVPCHEIARQLGLEPRALRARLQAFGIEAENGIGAQINIVVPIESYLPDIDAVGSARKMSRDQIAAEILRIVFSAGADAIENVLEKGAA